MNIHIIAVGTLKERFWRDAAAEYQKRLGRFGKITITELPEQAGSGGAQDVSKEGDAILKKLDKGGFTVALCVEGKAMDSPSLSALMDRVGLEGKSCVTFVIGGSDGLDERVKQAADLRLSFSPMTFPHQLMRVMLLEQVYRSFKISAGESYHK